jgi:cell division protein ZapA (FtsZ GTPase activity inhibitor)
MDSTTVEKVEIEIQHNKFTISCKAGESDAFRKAARTLNRDIAEMQGLTSNRLPIDQVISLVAVNYCKENLSREADFRKEMDAVKNKVNSLMKKLDKIGAEQQ